VLAAALGAGSCATGSTEPPADGPAQISTDDIVIEKIDGQAAANGPPGSKPVAIGPFLQVSPGFHTLQVRIARLKLEWGPPLARLGVITSTSFEVCLKALPRRRYTVKAVIKHERGAAVVVDETTGREVEKTCGLEDDD